MKRKNYDKKRIYNQYIGKAKVEEPDRRVPGFRKGQKIRELSLDERLDIAYI